jgi:hypothetical protein
MQPIHTRPNTAATIRPLPIRYSHEAPNRHMGRLTRYAASIRFVFLEPALCLQFPPDSRSPETPSPFGEHFPLPGMWRTFTSK